LLPVKTSSQVCHVMNKACRRFITDVRRRSPAIWAFPLPRVRKSRPILDTENADKDDQRREPGDFTVDANQTAISMTAVVNRKLQSGGPPPLCKNGEQKFFPGKITLKEGTPLFFFPDFRKKSARAIFWSVSAWGASVLGSEKPPP